MSGKVISFFTKRPLDEQRIDGTALCVGCQHEWKASAPVGVVWLQCPSCRFFKGRFVAHVQEDGAHYHCDCGNELFFMKEDHFYCANCGQQQRFG